MTSYLKKLFHLSALISLLGLIPAGQVTAQTFASLYEFTGITNSVNLDGAVPNALIVSGTTLYGTASGGGSSGYGTVFKISTNGTGFTTLLSFPTLLGSPPNTNVDGVQPYGSLVLSGSTLYGTAIYGGLWGHGTVFRINTDGTGYLVLHTFSALGGINNTNSDGADPYGGLALSGSTIYGTARYGGSWNSGTVFAVNTDGSGFTTLHHFRGGTDGSDPFAPLIISGNTLYGTTRLGGNAGEGTVFSINTDGSAYATLHSFSLVGFNPGSGFSTNSDGANPAAGLTISDGTLYGTAYAGGNPGFGTIFKVGTNGSGFTTLHGFTSVADGGNPAASLILSGNVLYGTASDGGRLSDATGASGTVFEVNTDGTGFTTLYSFSGGNDGGNPPGVVFAGTTLYGSTGFGGSSGNHPGSGALFSISLPPPPLTMQTVTNLHSFTNGIDGGNPNALILAATTLFGTTSAGGSASNGTVFSINSDGTGFATLHAFTVTAGSISANSDGASPFGTLALSGSSLYGTAVNGGSSGKGTIFKIDTNGTGFTTLYNFTALSSGINSDGAAPVAGLILSGGTLYGAASVGGSSGRGTLFKISTNGTGFTRLHSFAAVSNSTNSDGANPVAGLTLSGSTLYGTAFNGGPSGKGVVFSINSDGTGFTTLHSFSAFSNATNSDGANPIGQLTVSGSTIYGTATAGGNAGKGAVFALNINGTGFTTLHHFATNSYGATPYGGLILSGGTLYGTTYKGGSSGYGAVYALNTNGTGFTTLYSFTDDFSGTNGDGATPQAGLILSGNTFYGSTASGGTSGFGTVFRLPLGTVISGPLVSIISSGANLLLTWSANAAGFTLQSSANLGSSAVWNPASPAPTIVNGQNTVTVPFSGTRIFYRLIH